MATRKYSVEIALRALDLTRTAVNSVDKNFARLNSRLQSLSKMSTNVTQVGETFQSVGIRIGAAGAVITGALALMSKEAISHEVLFAKMANTVGTDLTDAVSKYEPIVKKIGLATGRNLDDITLAMIRAKRAGIEDANMLSYMETAAKVATGEFITVDETVGALTKTMNIWGIEQKDAMKTAEQLAIVNRATGTTFSDFGESFGPLSEVAKSFGAGLSETAAAVGIVKKVAGDAGTAMNNLSMVFMGIANPSKEATDEITKLNSKLASGDGLKMSIEEIQKVGFLEWIKKLKSVTGGSASSINKLFGSRQVKTVLALINNYDKLATVTGKVNAATNEGRTVNQNFANAMKTIQVKIDRTKNSLISAGEEIGSKLLPAIGAIADLFSRALGFLNRFMAKHETLTKVVAITAAIFGVLLTVIGGILLIVGTLMTSIAGIAAGIITLATVAGPAMAIIGSIFAGVGAAVGAVVAAVNILDIVIGAVIAVISSFFIAFIAGFVVGFIDALGPLLTIVGNFFTKVGGFFLWLGGIIKDWIVNIWDKFIGALKTLFALGKRFGFFMGTLFSQSLGVDVKANVETPEAKVKSSMATIVTENKKAADKVRKVWTIASGVTSGNIFGIAAAGSMATTEASIGKKFKNGFASEKIASAVKTGATGGSTRQFNIDRIEMNNATDPDAMIYELERRAAMAGI